MLRKATQKGFTIVELLIVIAVIGILAVLVLNTYSGVQARARDTDRQNDISQLATQLEIYYEDNGTYPAFTDQLNTDSWVQTNLPGTDLSALRAPDQDANSLVSGATTGKNNYGYATTTGCAGTEASSCEYFRLTATKESDSSTITKDSLNGTVPSS